MTGGTLSDLKGLTEPAKVLIERISDAVGGLARPWQIERLARAEGRAEVIRAEARIAVSEVEQRAIRRLVHEEGRKQENIESIAEQAADQVRSDAKPEEIEADWLTAFFDRCRGISDREMQAIWAKMLADEANGPGTYQRKTIDLLSTLSRQDAELFSGLKIISLETIDRIVPLVYDHDSDILKKHGFDFETLNRLAELGLINFSVSSNFHLNVNVNNLPVKYGDQRLILQLKEDRKFDTGRMLFTRSGSELIRLCPSIVDQAVLEWWMEIWNSKGIQPISDVKAFG